jgi:hypothetical protein
MTDDVPDGEFALVVEALIDWKNERYLKDLSRDVKRGLHDLAEQGFAPGGFPPRGYLLVKEQIGFKRNGKPRIASRWIPDPELAPRVQQAFQMKAQQATYQEIHDATRIFKTRGCYVHFFRNKTYLGIRKCGETEIVGCFSPEAQEGREMAQRSSASKACRERLHSLGVGPLPGVRCGDSGKL